MRAMLIAAFCIIACGGKKVDKAVDEYLNRDLATVRAKIVAAREAYGKVAAADIDQPGKRPYLAFNLGDVAAPFLAQALAEAKAIKPPPPAVPFHDYTISVLSEEAPLIAEMAAAVSVADAETFKAAHARMMDLQERVIRWEDYRTKLVFSSGARLGPLPRLQLPEPKADNQPPPESGSSHP